jgi:rhodanese-related sulfurtransferase
MIQNITAKELVARLEAGEKMRLVDVRTQMEFNRGHIPEAVNLPLGTFNSSIPEISAEETVVMMCQHGMRSKAACKQVEGTYSNLFNLVGGYPAWKATQKPAPTQQTLSRRIDRQAHFFAGTLITLAFLLSHFAAPNWMFLAALPAFGLLLDALTGFCPVTVILKNAPWNTTA